MSLEMKAGCEKCGGVLAADAVVFICPYECTFCADCATKMHHVCPNCGGELVRQPRRKASLGSA